MIYKPHNYQAYCIDRIVKDPAIGLFLRPGLGKTSITLSDKHSEILSLEYRQGACGGSEKSCRGYLE